MEPEYCKRHMLRSWFDIGASTTTAADGATNLTTPPAWTPIELDCRQNFRRTISDDDDGGGNNNNSRSGGINIATHYRFYI